MYISKYITSKLDFYNYTSEITKVTQLRDKETKILVGLYKQQTS